MTNYRRNFINGGSFFFTANLAERRLHLPVDYIDLLRQAFRHVRRRHQFDIEAIVKRCLVYSITLSERTRNVSGIVSPSAFAVVRLMTKSNLVGCSTGMSAGLVPRRI